MGKEPLGTEKKNRFCWRLRFSRYNFMLFPLWGAMGHDIFPFKQNFIVNVFCFDSFPCSSIQIFVKSIDCLYKIYVRIKFKHAIYLNYLQTDFAIHNVYIYIWSFCHMHEWDMAVLSFFFPIFPHFRPKQLLYVNLFLPIEKLHQKLPTFI